MRRPRPWSAGWSSEVVSRRAPSSAFGGNGARDRRCRASSLSARQRKLLARRKRDARRAVATPRRRATSSTAARRSPTCGEPDRVGRSGCPASSRVMPASSLHSAVTSSREAGDGAAEHVEARARGCRCRPAPRRRRAYATLRPGTSASRRHHSEQIAEHARRGDLRARAGTRDDERPLAIARVVKTKRLSVPSSEPSGLPIGTPTRPTRTPPRVARAR